MRVPKAGRYYIAHCLEDWLVSQNRGFLALTWLDETWCKISGPESSTASTTGFSTRQLQIQPSKRKTIGA